jgi:hypothetical protein
VSAERIRESGKRAERLPFDLDNGLDLAEGPEREVVEAKPILVRRLGGTLGEVQAHTERSTKKLVSDIRRQLDLLAAIVKLGG